ncbi:AIF_collapsed_G0005830.mRNA.1.CDS.1 [Saccharomyces cerevisiae]|nr:AIF_collapsed_G0005830.mRNA.1.CDS.1 [Saccharomyces cerevisiae]
MSENHVPAWKRIALKRQTISSGDESKEKGQSNLIDDDPLNITTHLSTGNLTKKEKKRIINGESKSSTKKGKRVSKPGTKKKEKLSKDEKNSKKNKILKDQLRYLIEFFRTKSESKFPTGILELESVKENYGDSLIKDEPSESGVVEYIMIFCFYISGTLQGKSKEELISKCKGKLKQWNDYVEDQETKIKALIAEDKASEPINGEEKEEGEKDGNAEHGKQKEVQDEQEEVQMPNKELVQRSLKLLEIWKNDDSEQIELKNFFVDV